MNIQFMNASLLHKYKDQQCRKPTYCDYKEDGKTKCRAFCEDSTEEYCFSICSKHREMVKARGFNVPQAEEKR